MSNRQKIKMPLRLTQVWCDGSRTTTPPDKGEVKAILKIMDEVWEEVTVMSLLNGLPTAEDWMDEEDFDSTVDPDAHLVGMSVEGKPKGGEWSEVWARSASCEHTRG